MNSGWECNICGANGDSIFVHVVMPSGVEYTEEQPPVGWSTGKRIVDRNKVSYYTMCPNHSFLVIIKFIIKWWR